MTNQKPSVGRTVHYVSHGTPLRLDGTQAYPSVCRAAIVTEVGVWVTVETTPAESFSHSEGRPVRYAQQWYYGDAVHVAVLNPTGEMFHHCLHDEDGHAGGTWHWPEIV